MIPASTLTDLSDRLSTEQSLLLNASDSCSVGLITEPFHQSVDLVMADLTICQRSGLAPRAGVAGPQKDLVNPSTGESLLDIKTPIGGFRWVTPVDFEPTLKVYGFALANDTFTVLYGTHRLEKPINLTAAKQTITAPHLQIPTSVKPTREYVTQARVAQAWMPTLWGSGSVLRALAPIVWLQADRGLLTTGGAPVTADGQPITRIIDQSGFANDALQGGNAANSVCKFAIQNGKRVIRNSTGGWFNFAAMDLGNEHTMFVVGKPTNAMMVLGGEAGNSFAFHNPPNFSYTNNFPTSQSIFPEIWTVQSIKTFRRNGRTVRAYHDGLQVQLDIQLNTDDHFALTNFLSWSNIGDFNWTGDLCELIIFPNSLQDSEVAQVHGYLTSKWAIPQVQPVICDGNSLTFGFLGTPYPTQMQLLLGPTYFVSNYGISGITTETMVERFNSTIRPFLTFPKSVLVVLEGVNSMTPIILGESPAAAYAALASYVANAKAVGNHVKVAVCTMTDTSRVSEPNQTTYNNLVRANSAGAHVVIDLRADARLANVSNPTYFADDVHLTTAGYGVMAEIITPVVQAL